MHKELAYLLVIPISYLLLESWRIVYRHTLIRLICALFTAMTCLIAAVVAIELIAYGHAPTQRYYTSQRHGATFWEYAALLRPLDWLWAVAAELSPLVLVRLWRVSLDSDDKRTADRSLGHGVNIGSWLFVACSMLILAIFFGPKLYHLLVQ